MIEMRAHHHVLVFQDRVAALQDADDVFAVARLRFDRDLRLSFLRGLSSKESCFALLPAP